MCVLKGEGDTVTEMKRGERGGGGGGGLIMCVRVFEGEGDRQK